MIEAVLIAGPTASGKSDLAIRVAEALGGQVVNADSQQIYAAWRVLSARPGPEDEARVAHRLYGHVALETAYSVGQWLRDLEDVLATDAVPVITGGTGLYFKALTEGLAPIPPVPPEVRIEATHDLERMGLAAFAERLAHSDPDTAAAIDMANPRRVQRAWEVLQATGTGLDAWQKRTPPPRLPTDRAITVVLEPQRQWLYARCDARFDRMLAAGALDEVAAVRALGLPPATPGMKALGAAELGAYLDGEITLDEARERACTETRRYAKRQSTWMRNQMGHWPRLDPSDTDAVEAYLARVRAGASAEAPPSRTLR